ncbi:uncharacterized protein LOC120342974 [Styela clava]
MRGPPNGKRLIGHGLLELALILAALRQTNVLDFSQDSGQEEAVYPHDGFYDDGPLLGIVSPAMHHFQQHPLWGGPTLSQKSIDNYYDNIIDDYDHIVEEYDNIMRDIRSRPPAIINPAANHVNVENRPLGTRNNRSVITMILSIPNESSSFRSNGGVQVSRNFNFQTEGAVGGFGVGLPYSADESFDLFNNYVPENMRDDDIDNLILSSINEISGNTASNQSNPDVRWQQYLSDFDNFYPGHKSLNSTFENWGNFDILNEAMQSAELFLPLVPNSQNSSELEFNSLATPLTTEENSDLITSSRIEMIETSEWSSQNHQEDLLFPLLPPPSYEEIMAADQANRSSQNTVKPEESNEHMHDHTYFNSSTPPPPVALVIRPAGYAIRSRHEVSTRVISVAPRPRHISGSSSQSTTSELSVVSEPTLEEHEITRSGTRRITTSSETSVEDMEQDFIGVSELDLDTFEITPVNSASSFFQNLTNDVRLHREVVLFSVEIDSMDLNALYQQDIDLGVNWPTFEPVKTIKDVGFNEKLTFNPEEYVVDGETGEYLPIVRENKIQKEVNTDDAETGQNSEFNIDECLDFLQNSMDSGTGESIQSQGSVAQIDQSYQVLDKNVGSINAELWDDIATLSEAYLALDSGDFTADMSPNGSVDSDNSQQYQQLNSYQNEMYASPVQVQVSEQKPIAKEQQFYKGTYHNYPTPPYVEQSESPPTFAHPTSVTFPAENPEKPFGPADVEEAKLAEMLITQQNDLLVQLDNVAQINLGAGGTSPLSAEQPAAPGSWFFGGAEPENNFTQVLTELDMMNNIPNQAGAYLNPPNAPYVPPPINNLDVVGQGRVSRESESMDSGFGDGMGVTQHMDIEMADQDVMITDPSVLISVEDNYIENQTDEQFERKYSQRESRDLKKARELNINLTMDQIINSPVEEYNELLSRTNYNAAQQSLIRDIRRRGKNKVAAQNCRKRKIETISSMEIDIDSLSMKRQELVNKQKSIEEMKKKVQAKYNQLYQQIFNSLRDESGRPYDQGRYSLQQVEGAIILVPGNHGNRDDKMDSNRTVAFFDLSKVKLEKDI